MVDIEERLYSEIKEYCKVNGLKIGDFVNKIVKKGFMIEKYGEKPGIVFKDDISNKESAVIQAEVKQEIKPIVNVIEKEENIIEKQEVKDEKEIMKKDIEKIIEVPKKEIVKKPSKRKLS